MNLGCPTNAAVRKGVGAALLKQPELLSRLLTTMRRAVPGLLSAKLRAGFDTTSEALTNARLVQDSGLDFLTIHPRRRIDHYRGSADWRIVALVQSELSIPVVGNGDIWYAQSALQMFEQTRCDAVMLGRPALRNPWIFRQISELLAGREPFRPAGMDVARHLRRLATAYASRAEAPSASALGPLKEQLGYLCRSVPDSGALQRRLQRLPTLELLLEAADEGFGAFSAEALDLGAAPRPS
ncbi:MAG: tRNA-dihydrouridine synthase family protein [Polyangiaceae bacterium]